MIRKCFCEILQNLYFADNRKDDKIEKTFKMRPVIDHLKSKFSEVLPNDSEQRIDKHQRQIWNEAVYKTKTNKMGFQILVLLFE